MFSGVKGFGVVSHRVERGELLVHLDKNPTNRSTGHVNDLFGRPVPTPRGCLIELVQDVTSTNDRLKALERRLGLFTPRPRRGRLEPRAKSRHGSVEIRTRMLRDEIEEAHKFLELF